MQKHIERQKDTHKHIQTHTSTLTHTNTHTQTIGTNLLKIQSYYTVIKCWNI